MYSINYIFNLFFFSIILEIEPRVVNQRLNKINCVRKEPNISILSVVLTIKIRMAFTVITLLLVNFKKSKNIISNTSNKLIHKLKNNLKLIKRLKLM